MAHVNVDELLSLRGGSTYRDALARYLTANLEKLRAIASRKLGRSSRSVFDSEEVVASVVRRMDDLAQRDSIRARSEDELWALIARIVTNATVSRIRLLQVARRHLAEDGPYAALMASRVAALETDDEASLLVYRLIASVPDATDRQILLLRLRGMPLPLIARELGLGEGAARMRYHRVCQRLEERLGPGGDA